MPDPTRSRPIPPDPARSRPIPPDRQAIVEGNIKWPQKVGQPARACITGLLEFSPGDRLGMGKAGAADIKREPFFKLIAAWQSVITKKIEAPYKPAVKDDLDASLFDEFDDPDVGDAVKDVPKGSGFEEFKTIAEKYDKN